MLHVMTNDKWSLKNATIFQFGGIYILILSIETYMCNIWVFLLKLNDHYSISCFWLFLRQLRHCTYFWNLKSLNESDIFHPNSNLVWALYFWKVRIDSCALSTAAYVEPVYAWGQMYSDSEIGKLHFHEKIFCILNPHNLILNPQACIVKHWAAVSSRALELTEYMYVVWV
jgi:hypothetical protein